MKSTRAVLRARGNTRLSYEATKRRLHGKRTGAVSNRFCPPVGRLLQSYPLTYQVDEVTGKATRESKAKE